MNKKRYSWSAFLLMCLLVVSVSLTSCDEGDEVDTNQMDTGAIALNAFGPSPAVRGGELRLIGTNLDKVTSIDLPGAEGISDITVVGKYEIRITIPQTAQPGLIGLNTPDGKITSKTPIGYSEPISISGIAPLALKAGGVLTIEGDYLNIVEEIIFADGIHVLKADFESQTRAKIEVKVPLAAQSGKVIVSNGADLLSDGEEIPAWVYSEEELDVKLPEITAVTPNPLKAGGALTITGVDFDLVHKVIMPGGEEFVVEDATTSIVVEETPADLKEGVVTLVAYSGVEVTSEALALIKPAITSLSATTVKNGSSFTINGTNLDLVTSVAFQNGSVVTEDFLAHSAEVIELTLPLTATNGAFVLHTASETSTDGEALTFVVPEITGLSVSEIRAKQTLVIEGSHLDVVEKVFFGAMEGTIDESSTAQALSVVVPVGAESGSVKLLTTNGSEVESTQTLTINVVLPEITSIVCDEGPGGKVVVEGTDLSILKTIYLLDKEGAYTIPVTDYGLKTDTYMEFYHVMGAATGDLTPLMVTFDGDEGYMPEFYCGATDPITEATLMISDFNGGGASQSTWAGVVEFGLPAVDLNGTAAMLGLTGNGWQWTWSHNWDTRPALADPGQYVLKFDICIVTPAPGVSAGMTLKGWDTAVDLGQPFNVSTEGRWVTMTFDVLNSGMVIDGTGDWGIWINGTDYDLTGIMIDNLRFDPK